jgi:hypothetical protein
VTDPTTALLASAFQAIGAIVTRVIKGAGLSPKALAAGDALTVIGAIIDTVQDGLAGGKVSPEDAHKALDKLLHKIAANDHAADAAIAHRFDKG